MVNKVSVNLSPEKFMRAVTAADFRSLIGDDLSEFLRFVDRCGQDQLGRLLIRFLFQRENQDGVPTPYYIWASYPMHNAAEDQELELYTPDFSDHLSLLETPEELQGMPYFEIAIG